MTQDIRAFEYALGLFSVLIGLAIADIAMSFHRLVRSRTAVTWDPLALLAALYALFIAIGMWFDLWGVRSVSEARHFFFYLSMVASLFVLFLIAASSLPDEADEPIDLRKYYEGNRRYFWSLVALFQLGYIAHGLYFVGAAAALAEWSALLVVPVLLAGIRSRAVHYAGLAVLFAVNAWHYAPYSIN